MYCKEVSAFLSVHNFKKKVKRAKAEPAFSPQMRCFPQHHNWLKPWPHRDKTNAEFGCSSTSKLVKVYD